MLLEGPRFSVGMVVVGAVHLQETRRISFNLSQTCVRRQVACVVAPFYSQIILLPLFFVREKGLLLRDDERESLRKSERERERVRKQERESESVQERERADQSAVKVSRTKRASSSRRRLEDDGDDDDGLSLAQRLCTSLQKVSPHVYHTERRHAG